MLAARTPQPPAACYRSIQTAGSSTEAEIISDILRMQHADWAASAKLGAALRDLDAVRAERKFEGEGAIRPDAYLQARAFLIALLPLAPHPSIAADDEGEPSFEWEFAANRWLVASIAADGKISYAASKGLERQRGTTFFDGAVPPAIASLLADLQRD